MSQSIQSVHLVPAVHVVLLGVELKLYEQNAFPMPMIVVYWRLDVVVNGLSSLDHSCADNIYSRFFGAADSLPDGSLGFLHDSCGTNLDRNLIHCEMKRE